MAGFWGFLVECMKLLFLPRHYRTLFSRSHPLQLRVQGKAISGCVRVFAWYRLLMGIVELKRPKLNHCVGSHSHATSNVSPGHGQ